MDGASLLNTLLCLFFPKLKPSDQNTLSRLQLVSDQYYILCESLFLSKAILIERQAIDGSIFSSGISGHAIIVCKGERSSSRYALSSRLRFVYKGLSIPKLTIRSAWNRRGNCDPLLVTVPLKEILQLAVFIYCLSTRKYICPVDTVPLYCSLQLAVFC
jgi:hypothetical protein